MEKGDRFVFKKDIGFGSDKVPCMDMEGVVLDVKPNAVFTPYGSKPFIDQYQVLIPALGDRVITLTEGYFNPISTVRDPIDYALSLVLQALHGLPVKRVRAPKTGGPRRVETTSPVDGKVVFDKMAGFKLANAFAYGRSYLIPVPISQTGIQNVMVKVYLTSDNKFDYLTVDRSV